MIENKWRNGTYINNYVYTLINRVGANDNLIPNLYKLLSDMLKLYINIDNLSTSYVDWKLNSDKIISQIPELTNIIIADNLVECVKKTNIGICDVSDFNLPDIKVYKLKENSFLSKIVLYYRSNVVLLEK